MARIVENVEKFNGFFNAYFNLSLMVMYAVVKCSELGFSFMSQIFYIILTHRF